MKYALPFHTAKNPLELSIPVSGKRNDAWIFLCADVHADSPHSDRELYREHIREARRRKAGAFVFGDMFDVMQSFGDKRASPDGKRDEDSERVSGLAYLRAVVNNMANIHRGYEKTLSFLSPGNHETAMLRYHHWDLVSEFADLINRRGGNLKVGGYRGYIRVSFRGQSFLLYYHHGAGGSAPVTRGVIRSARRAEYVRADVVVTGHIHTGYMLPILSETSRGRHVQRHIQLSTYLDPLAKQAYGWATEREFAPSPMGGAWLYVRRHSAGLRVNVVDEWS